MPAIIRKILNISASVLTSSGMYFATVLILTFTIFDGNTATVRRLNQFKDASIYPVEFIKKKRPFIRRDFIHARKYYEGLAKMAPPLGRAFGMVGFCHYYLGNYDKAIWYYEKAIEKRPGYFWFDYNLGVIYYNLGQYNKAAEYFEKSLPVDPDSKNLFIPVIRESDAWDMPQRMKIYNKSMQLYSNLFLSNYKYILHSYLKLKDYEKARETAHRAIAENLLPNDCYYYYFAGLASYRLGNRNTATSYLNQCLKIDNKHADAYFYLGKILQEISTEELTTDQSGERLLKIAELLKKDDHYATLSTHGGLSDDLALHPRTYIAPIGLEALIEQEFEK